MAKIRFEWNQEKIQFLLENWNKLSLYKMGAVMHTILETLNTKAKELGLEIKKSDNRWTQVEIEKLLYLAKTMTINELAIALNRTSGSIRTKTNSLDIKLISNNKNAWTQDEIKQLKELIINYTTIEIAEIMNRTEDAVYIKAKKLGLDIKSKHRKWTKEDEEALQDMWGSYSIEYIAKKLDRTPSGISNRVFVLKLGSAIANNYDGLTIQEMCDLFGKSRDTISIDWAALGLKIQEIFFSSRSYTIVTIADLYNFLECNQSIWDSRTLEKNILGKEPEWLLEKRKKDRELDQSYLDRITITKQQLIAARKYYLELAEQQLIQQSEQYSNKECDIIENGIQLIKKKVPNE
ncbi:MAG: hypothetical protein RR359_02105 [Bacilli bacterium]